MEHPTTRSMTPGNVDKLDQLRGVIGEVLAEVLQRGFYGRASVELIIDDGTIQRISRKVERTER